MVRQAHTYLAGAVSGTALIAAAVVAFVLLVSLQALRDWPLAGITGGSDDSAVSSGQAAAGGAATSGTAAGAGAVTARPPGAGAGANGQQRGDRAGGGGQQIGAATIGAPPSPAPGSPAGEAPASDPVGGGAPSPTTQSTSSSSGGGGGSGGGEGNGPISLPGTGGSGGSSGQSPSGAVTGAVNDTVSGADQTLGGPLDDTGVTKVTEEAVNGVAGPESTVGEIVDKVSETVGGLARR
ncbi:MAG TPA: hypothetical protein VIY71_05665 [Solirubrobacterales bacterium]